MPVQLWLNTSRKTVRITMPNRNKTRRRCRKPYLTVSNKTSAGLQIKIDKNEMVPVWRRWYDGTEQLWLSGVSSRYLVKWLFKWRSCSAAMVWLINCTLPAHDECSVSRLPARRRPAMSRYFRPCRPITVPYRRASNVTGRLTSDESQSSLRNWPMAQPSALAASDVPPRYRV